MAASNIAFKTSARFKSKRILVAITAISDFLFIFTFVPNYRAKAVTTVLVKSHIMF